MSLARIALAPASHAYALLVRARVAAYGAGLLGRSRLAGPVVSVGNLNVGGSGKTPVVELVAKLLTEAGHATAILSRGYRGSYRGAGLVVGAGAGRGAEVGASVAGDEPVMLADNLLDVVVAVGPRRAEVGRVVEERFGRRVHVLDDGFQHLPLERDLDIVCVHPRDLGDRPLPSGRLREPVSALRRAHVILWSGEAAPSQSDRSLLGDAPVYALRRRVVGFSDPAGDACPTPASAFAMSGIARPERFHDDVARQATILGARSFPDHHSFAPNELEAVFAEARLRGAEAVVTTQKDATRLQSVPGDPPLRVLRIEAVVEDAAFAADVLGAAAVR